MRHASRFIIVSLLSAAALVWAPTASASIVIGQSIGGVKLGASQAQVQQVLGAPLKSENNSFFYPESVGLRIGFQQGRVNGVLSISKKQKTSKSITIGSSHSQFKRAYPTANCLAGPYGPQSLYCAVTARFNGRESYTSFLFTQSKGSVTQIELGYGRGLAQETQGRAVRVAVSGVFQD